MNIAVFSDSYKPYVSGVVRSIDMFRRELAKLGHETYIFAPGYPGYVDTEPGVFRYRSIQAPTNPDYRLAIPVSPTVGRRLRELKIDVIHTHSPFLLSAYGARCARKYRIPLVFTYHTLYEEYVHYSPIARGLAKKLMRKVSRDYSNKCDLVITPTEVIRRLLLDYGVTTPIIVNPTGIDVSRFRGLDRGFLRTRHDIPSENKILLYVGRLGKEKNVDFLLRSFRLIADADSRTTLVLVGGGPEKGSLEGLARELGIDRRVVFAGPMPPDEVPRAYAGGDIFTFCSVTETQGMTISEAMAAGLPVVAVKAFGSMDMVDDGINGILVEEDEGKYASAVLSLLNDPYLLNRLAKRTLEKADELSSTATAKRLEEAYRSVIGSYRRR